MSALSKEFSAVPEPRASEPVTKAEHDARTRSRASPHAAPQLTPGGGIETEVHREIEAQNERRIAFLNERLGQQQSHAARDFEASRGEAMPRREKPGPKRSFEHAR